MAALPRLTRDKVGCGCWYTLHSAALDESPEGKAATLYLIKMFSTRFICKSCQEHLAAFIKLHDPKTYAQVEVGLSMWCWMAHREATLDANKHLIPGQTRKEELSWADYVKLYKVGQPLVAGAMAEPCPPEVCGMGHTAVPPTSGAPTAPSTSSATWVPTNITPHYRLSSS